MNAFLLQPTGLCTKQGQLDQPWHLGTREQGHLNTCDLNVLHRKHDALGVIFISFTEQEKEEGGEFHSVQGFCPDLAA